MKSISGKILSVTLSMLTTIVTLLTIIAIVVTTRVSKEDSENLITEVCEKETQSFNDEFRFLESSVTTVYEYLKDVEEDCTDENELLSGEICGWVENIALSVAYRTEGAMTVYFRYNPDLTNDGTSGFFWSRNNDGEKFSYVTPTDILQYEEDDMEHVGWYYTPKEKHEATWMAPYYNSNIDVFMISYVIPYYTSSGTFLGVIGMDIDFNKILSMTDEVTIYKTGKIKLVDMSSKCIYSMDENDNVMNENLSDSLYESILTDKGYVKNNAGVRCLFRSGLLSNGMSLILSVPLKEVNARRNSMILTFSILVVLSLLATAFFIVRITNKMVKPLKELTRVTGNYAKGDWDEKFVCNTNDEIQDLSESISSMAATTKTYIGKLSQNAMMDNLTGLKNKNCYLSFIEKYKDHEVCEYALVVFDVNYLKKTNDEYGHEEGDKLLKMAAEYICNVFDHSPVFRIGGDEFCAILENRDYRNHDALCEQFKNEMEKIKVDNVTLSISYGIAFFPADGKSYDEIFKIADERMYERKKQMKAVRE